MRILIVDIYVIPEYQESFLTLMIKQAKLSQQEDGNIRYDLIHDSEDPHHFVLYEVYRDEAAFQEHRESVHTQQWKTAVEPFMARPRTRTRGVPLYFGEGK